MSRQSVRRYLLPVHDCGLRDEFDPASSNVIPTLAEKWVDANHLRVSHDTRRAHEGFGLPARRLWEDGLRATIDRYESRRGADS
jgi:hypothetical protein